MNRLLALCAPILAVTALVLAPAVAQAEDGGPYWYAHHVRLAPEEALPVRISGVTSIYFESFGERVTCHAKGAGAIANAGEVGVSQISELSFRECRFEEGGSEHLSLKVCPRHSKVELNARGLPWDGVLTPLLREEIEGVSLEPSCSGEDAETVSGTISGLVGVGKLQFGEEQIGDEEFNFLAPDSLFTAVWHIEGPADDRQVTTIASS
jgi:hypothetical protein